jgi:hypothetical protein
LQLGIRLLGVILVLRVAHHPYTVLNLFHTR